MIVEIIHLCSKYVYQKDQQLFVGHNVRQKGLFKVKLFFYYEMNHFMLIFESRCIPVVGGDVLVSRTQIICKRFGIICIYVSLPKDNPTCTSAKETAY